MSTTRPLIAAWVGLVAAGLGTTLVTLLPRADIGGRIAAASVLALAGLKSAIILRRYLGLAASAFWTRGFDLVIGLFLLLAYGLYLLGGTT